MLCAEDVVFQAGAPKQVIVGKPFQLTYTINTRSRDIQAPDFEGFDYLAGPYTSTSSSTSFVNGKRTSSFTQTYTYTLMAQREGTFTLAPATITADGSTHRSNGVKITVLPADQQPNNGASSGTSGNSGVSGSSGNNSLPSKGRDGEGSVSSENIFVRTIVSKTRVHEQEALLLTYKLYFAGVDVAQLTNNTKIPEFTGFLKQEIERGEIQTELEHYNGRNYQTAVLYQTLLYPQHAGDIKIDPATFEAVLRVQTRAQVRSIFDDFFGSYTNVTKPLTAAGTTIHVSSLPSGKPQGFSGGVGRFTLNSSISGTELTTNDAVTIKMDISGTGNMKLLKTPSIDWPEGFEEYDPKVTNNYKTTTAGVSGTKTIEYLAIPRAAGDYTIPALTFSYFDTESDSYKTLSTPEYTLHVKRGAGDNSADVNTVVSNYTAKEDIKQLGSDIRYIYTGDIRYTPTTSSEEGGGLIWLFYLLPAIGSLVVLVLFRKRIRENADITRVRYKKANKVAQKRLKAAANILKQIDKETSNNSLPSKGRAGEGSGAFYEEIERAAKSYLSDRLSIPTADLNKENISSILAAKSVEQSLIQETLDVLQSAEMARYFTGAAGSMQDLYDRTTKLIDNLENCKL